MSPSRISRAAACRGPRRAYPRLRGLRERPALGGRGLGLGVWSLGFRVQGLLLRALGSGSKVWDFGFRVSGFGVWGLGFRVEGWGLRVEALVFRD